MSSDYRTLIKYFLSWRILLFLVAIVSLFLIPKFGARFPYYDSALEVTGLPNWIWGFGNFDGVHYMRIAQRLYIDANSQAFFPVFPLLIRTVAFLLPKSSSLDLNIFIDPSFFYSGLLLSNVFFFVAIFVVYKLFSLDFDKVIVKKSVLLLFVFPTAFYFGSIYTESLFLLLSALSILLLRKKEYLWAGIIISIASATRITGFLLILVYLIELKGEKLDWRKILGLLLAPLGIFIYMAYLKLDFSNPIYFITSQASFGSNRLTNGIIFLPQVLFRYLRIFSSVSIFSSSFFIAMLETLFTLSSLGFTVYLYKKMRTSYWILTLILIIIPTLTGTLSSMPRYVLGAFLLLPFLAKSKYYSLLVILFTGLSVILLSLFVRGYWVS